MSQIGSSASFFLFGRAGAATGMWLPPRRRAFRSNGRQASHFRCNPSRMLVGPRTRFAANTVLPRLHILPRRDFSPRTSPPQGLQRSFLTP